jgi:hypothetical protein
MWVEELRLENIKCFQKTILKFSEGNNPFRWVTFLSENGGGKSTALQALGLLLAGPEGAQKLLPRPLAWLRDENGYGTISVRIHQGDNDPGLFGGSVKVRRVFGYSFFVTGPKRLTIRNKPYSEPTIVESVEKPLSWLRQHAFISKGTGWFAAGYGAFRRLTRDNRIIIPSLEPQARFTNFATQFDEDQPLSTFERWMVYLDYRIAKDEDKDEAKRQQQIGVDAINQILPEGVEFHRVTSEGQIYFNIRGRSVPTTTLSDGYRSVLALVGDLVWRLILAFPKSENPLNEEGVAIIDELDIHLHPLWQRKIAGRLRKVFPNLQFFVATHSPLIAAGGGDDALTLRFRIEDGESIVDRVQDIASMNVDRILQSPAFDLVSPYSPETQEKIDRYDSLARKGNNRKSKEEEEFGQLSLFMEKARPFGGPPEPGSLESRMEEYLAKSLK